MLDTLHGVGRWLVHDLGWISLETLVLTAIVYVVTRWGGNRSSRIRRWLWTLVVLKPVATMLIAWPLPSVVSPGTEMRALVETRADKVKNVLPLSAAISPSQVPPRQSRPAPAAPGAETQEGAASMPAVAQAGEGSVTGFAVLGALWLLGGLALCVYTAAGVVWLLRVRRQAVPLAADDLLAATDE